MYHCICFEINLIIVLDLENATLNELHHEKDIIIDFPVEECVPANKWLL